MHDEIMKTNFDGLQLH